MKEQIIKILIGLLILWAISNLYCQIPGYRLSRVYHNNTPINLGGGDTYFYYYSSDYAALPDSMIYAYYVSGNVEQYYTSKYNKDDNQEYIKEELIYFGNTAQDFPMYSTIGEYDTNGRICNKKGYMYSSVDTISTSYRVFYKYDNSGNLDSLNWHDPFDIGNSAFHIDDIECYERGRIHIEDIKWSPDSTYWYTGSRTVTSYQDDDTMTGAQYVNNLTATLGFIQYDDVFVQHFCSGKISDKTSMWHDNNDWVVYMIESHAYDENDRLVSCTLQRLYPDVIYTFKFEFTYDISGNLSAILRRNWDSNIDDWGDVADSHLYIWEQTTASDDNVITPVNLKLVTYPNPFSSELSITIQSQSKAPIEASVYNLKGQLVKSFGKSKSTSLTWDGKDKEGRAVSNGIYFIKAKQDGKVITSKIVRMR